MKIPASVLPRWLLATCLASALMLPACTHTGEHPKGEHPQKEHPKGEHPKKEEPKQEQPKK